MSGARASLLGEEPSPGPPAGFGTHIVSRKVPWCGEGHSWGGNGGTGHSGTSMACLGSEGQVDTKQAYRPGAQAPQRSRGGWVRVWWDGGLELADLLKMYPVDPDEGSS